MPTGDEVWVKRFDSWREAFPYLTYKAHQSFYTDFGKAFPDQKKYDALAVSTFFSHVLTTHDTFEVWELGGWRGEMANQMLPDFPQIRAWMNTEICPWAFHNGICQDKRYIGFLPDTWAWMTRFSPNEDSVVVLSHVIEHLTKSQLLLLLNYIQQAPWLYIQTPDAMGDEGRDWTGTWATHILECGWDEVTNILLAHRYKQVWRKNKSRIFKKVE